MKTKPIDKREKKEYRYQFLGYEEVGTGKFRKEPILGLGMAMVFGGQKIESFNILEIKKTVAMVFDKQTGIVKQTEIQKL